MPYINALHGSQILVADADAAAAAAAAVPAAAADAAVCLVPDHFAAWPGLAPVATAYFQVSGEACLAMEPACLETPTGRLGPGAPLVARTLYEQASKEGARAWKLIPTHHVYQTEGPLSTHHARIQASAHTVLYLNVLVAHNTQASTPVHALCVDL
eukprot:scaffold78978_cov41-Tisochrysis_lutea.AAC.4